MARMIRMQLHLQPEEKAKLFNEAKKAKYNGSASAVIRALIKKLQWNTQTFLKKSRCINHVPIGCSPSPLLQVWLQGVGLSWWYYYSRQYNNMESFFLAVFCRIVCLPIDIKYGFIIGTITCFGLFGVIMTVIKIITWLKPPTNTTPSSPPTTSDVSRHRLTVYHRT